MAHRLIFPFSDCTWFMQLNPARGRKHVDRDAIERVAFLVYAAQPREGTETGQGNNHREGKLNGLCSSTPRGDGNSRQYFASYAHARLGLCSSTPRGDGNSVSSSQPSTGISSVYAAQPREGTETAATRRPSSRVTSLRFMQLNPARGRKLSSESLPKLFSRAMGLCSSTPRGDGNICC